MSPNFISRRWRSKGHGIHSPLAFRMVTEVLRQDYSFYAFGHLDALPDNTVTPAMRRLIHRLTCEFRPSTFWIDPSLQSTSVGEAVRTASSLARRVADSREADLVIASHSIPSLHDRCVAIRLFPGAGTDEAFPTAGCFTFSNGRSLVAVLRPDLPRQHFEVNF